MTLHGTEEDIEAIISYIQIVSWPLSGSGASNETQIMVDFTWKSDIDSQYSNLSYHRRHRCQFLKIVILQLSICLPSFKRILL